MFSDPKNVKKTLRLCLASVFAEILNTIAFKDNHYILDNFDVLRPQK